MGIKTYQEKNTKPMKKIRAQSGSPVKRKVQKTTRKYWQGPVGVYYKHLSCMHLAWGSSIDAVCAAIICTATQAHAQLRPWVERGISGWPVLLLHFPTQQSQTSQMWYYLTPIVSIYWANWTVKVTRIYKFNIAPLVVYRAGRKRETKAVHIRMHGQHIRMALHSFLLL